MNEPIDRPPPQGDAARVPILGPATINAPAVVLALVGVLAASYLVFVFAPPAIEGRLEFWLTLWPRRTLMWGAAPGGWLGAVGPLFSHIFVHTEFMHFFANAGFLLALGAPVAQRMGAGVPGADQMQANARFIVFFMLAGLVGGIAFMAAHPAELTFARGASGAISGLLGAVVRFALRPVRERMDEPWRLLDLLDRRVVTASLVIVLSNIALGMIPLFGMTIAGEAHIGGYLFGLAAFPFFALRPPR